MALAAASAMTSGTQSPEANLAAAYERVPPLIVSVNSKNPSSGKLHLVRYALAPDGRFSERHFIEGHAATGSRWREIPAHLTAFDGAVLRVTEAGGAREYTETAAADLATTSPGPLQWAMAPATAAGAWIRWMQDAGDLSVHTTSGETTASSAAAGLELQWDAHLRIVKCVRRDAATEIEHSYSAFESTVPGLPEMPTRRRERITVARDRESKVVRDVTIDLRITPSENAESDLAFPAKEFAVNKYDRDTGDVVATDGTLVYNKRHLEAALDERSAWVRVRPYAFVGLFVAVGAGLAIGLRRRLSA